MFSEVPVWLKYVQKKKAQARKTDRKMINKYIFFYQQALFFNPKDRADVRLVSDLIKEFKLYCVLD